MLAALAALAAAAVPVAPGFPAPPSRAVVFSREAGSDALGLAIVPKSRGVVLQASVVGEQGTGVAGLVVTFTVGSRATRGVPCKAGCYRATVQTARRPASVSVDVRGTATRVHWTVDVPAAWPPRDAHALVARAAATWRSLDSVSFHERLASSAHDSVTSTWRIQAPDRIAYHVDGGPAAVVIGERRWDRTSDSSGWVESPQAGLKQPVPPWVRVTDAHVLASDRRVWHVSFFDPGTPGWYALVIDKRTFRTLRVDMIATAHFMRDTYGEFNSAAPIVPPR